MYSKASDVKLFKHMIDNEYRVHWEVDNLPVAVRNDELGYVSRGYPVGFVTATPKVPREQHYLFNHVRIILRYHEDEEEFGGSRIVGFEVVPFSIKHEYEDSTSNFDSVTTVLNTCNQFNPAQYNPDKFQAIESKGEEVVYTYDVKWERSDVRWSNRWEVYLHGNPDDEIHYFSIINSLMIVLFLTGVVAMIMLRTLHKDISTYNEMQTLEEAQEESGWKLVHGDVFRPPSTSPMILSIMAGSGLQVLTMTMITMVCALFGLTSPANRGSLVTTLLMLFVFMGSIAGYASARIYKLFGGKEWKRNTLLAASFYPSIMGLIFIVINVVTAAGGSSQATPFGTLLGLLFVWMGVSTPLVFVGSYYGFKKDTITTPVRTNQIARHIPDQVWYTNPLFGVALGGVLPFGAVCIELFFIMSAMWLHQLYFVFGFLFVVLLILIITCAEITIVLTYFQLCNEDYRWWWRSFLSAGSSGFYLFLYSIWYYASKLTITTATGTFLYFAYMSMIAFTFFLLTGSIGFFSCLWFVRRIYGAIKVD
jgi:transmembrane 9 superfamily protein 2/4